MVFVDKPTDHPHVPSVALRFTEDVLYELIELVVDDPARFGDPDDILYRAFAGLSDDRAADFDELCDEWPWLRSTLPLVKAACESPDTNPTANLVLMEPSLSQQPFPTTSAGVIG